MRPEWQDAIDRQLAKIKSIREKRDQLDRRIVFEQGVLAHILAMAIKGSMGES